MSRLAHLRNHPFIVYDEERVRTRAYYLSLARPVSDPVQDWLDAEVAEIEEQARLRLFRALNPSSEVEFYDCYELPVGFVVPAGTATPKRPPIGPRSPRTCAFCQKTDLEVKFKSEAHLISETFGNRLLMTLEDCDACNQRDGRELEDSLAKMLIDARVLGRVKNKKGGVAKAKLADGRGSVGGTPHPEPLHVDVVEGDSSVELFNVGDGFVELTMPPSKFRPLSALRAIGRMAYLALPREIREEHSWLREWVIGERVLQPMKVWRFSYPNMFETVGITAWTRRPNANVPNAVVMFHLAHTVIVIAPTLDAAVIELLPPLPKVRPSLEPMAPNGWQTTYGSDEPVVEQWIQRFAGGDEYHLCKADGLNVKVRVHHEDTQLVFDGVLSTPSPDRPDERITYEIIGGTMPGRLTMSTTDGRTWRCTFNEASAIAVQVGLLLARGANLTIDDDKGKRIFPRAQGWVRARSPT